jgi:hypothetical protein
MDLIYQIESSSYPNWELDYSSNWAKNRSAQVLHKQNCVRKIRKDKECIREHKRIRECIGA